MASINLISSFAQDLVIRSGAEQAVGKKIQDYRLLAYQNAGIHHAERSPTEGLGPQVSS